MRHLESKREAAERRRVALMSKGIASFLERTMRRKGDVSSSSDGSVAEAGTYDVVDDDADGIAAQAHEAVNVANDSISNAKSSVLDQIRKTLDDAADILRESLELVVGGVVFLDPTIGYSETGHNEAYLDASTDLGQYVEGQEAAETEQNNSTEDIPPSELTSAFDDLYLASSTVRSSVDKHKPAKVQAMSAAQVATWDPESKVLDGKTLQTLINSYPNGNVWYMDDEGYFSSLEQMQ
ncbi:hypothetical protein M7I_2846 [Glarea lozoyensis 74030]|nr:hypothetical protein M7I_2846 [Glarea lozoyensis 74030]